MKKFLFLLLSTLLLAPSMASAQFEGSIPGSADPKWTCQMSARALYMNPSTNKIEYSATYRLTGDFGTSVSFITRVVQENSIPVVSSKNVQLSPTNGQSRAVTIAGKTLFNSEVSVGNGRPVTLYTALGNVSCGSVTLNLVRQPSIAQDFSSSFVVQPKTITNVNGIQQVEPNFPQPDPDDANPQPLDPNVNSIPQPNLAEQNVNNRVNIPQAEGSPNAEVSNSGEVTTPSPDSAVSNQNTGNAQANSGLQMPENTGNDGNLGTELEEENDLRAEQANLTTSQNNTVMYVMMGLIAMLLAVITYLLVKKN